MKVCGLRGGGGGKKRANCSTTAYSRTGEEKYGPSSGVHAIFFSFFFFFFVSFPTSFRYHSLGAAFAKMERGYNNSAAVMRRARAGDATLFFATVLPIFRDSFLFFFPSSFRNRPFLASESLEYIGSCSLFTRGIYFRIRSARPETFNRQSASFEMGLRFTSTRLDLVVNY